ncbi:MAG: response regulator transcription factor [Bacteroidetes bacterium]|nr:response regulator transcription factor [Bacteroidota bacterium]
MNKTNNTHIIRLLVVEDNATLVLAGLRNFFRPDRDLIQVSESVSCVEETLNIADNFIFDVILLDLMMPDHSPGENLAFLKTHFPGKPVVVYTSIDSDIWRKRMFNLGVHGYVHKNDGRDVLKRAIMDAFEGRVTLQVTDNENQQELTTNIPVKGDPCLTLVEKELLSMLADGLRYKQIGMALNMNDVIIESTVKRLRKKFGTNSTTQLIHILTKQGLL